MNKITNIIFSFLFIFLAIFLAIYHLGINKDSFSFLSFNNQNEQKTEKSLKNQEDGFKFGLDLIGGSYLIYNVDVSKIDKTEINDSIGQLKSVIQRRLNAFGTGDASVTVQKPSIFAENKNNYKMIVEIPGVSDSTEAKNKIGSIPLLTFKKQLENGEFEPIGLSGKHIKSASYGVGENGGNEIYINFNDEGKKIFGDFTTNNVGIGMGIFVKENSETPEKNISTSTIITPITGGTTRITGGFTKEYAKNVAQNLNNGAVSVPLSLESTDTISPTLGKDILFLGMKAAFVGLILVFLILIAVYGWSGILASFSLVFYTILNLSIFKLLGFTFTAAAIAGFIISIGMAVDANVLIFERIKEELKISSNSFSKAIKNGFSRAWLSIRDGNLSTIITAVILFFLTTPLIKGFAVTLAVGVLVSMFTAIVVTRVFLLSFVDDNTKNTKSLRTTFFGFEKKENN